MRASVHLIVLFLFASLLSELGCKERATGSGNATSNGQNSTPPASTAADNDLTPPGIPLAKFSLKLNDVEYTLEAPAGSIVNFSGDHASVVRGGDFGFRIELSASAFDSDRKWWKAGGGIYAPQRFMLDTAEELLVESKERGDARYFSTSLVKLPYIEATVRCAKDGMMGVDLQTKANCLLVLQCAKTLALKSAPPTDPLELLTWLTIDARRGSDGKVQQVRLGTAVTNGALPVLRKLPALKVLNIDGAHVSGSGLAAIDGFESVESVTLNPFGAVTAEMLKHIATLPNLTSLSIGGVGLTEIDDAGIFELQKAKKLQTLELVQTSLTDAGISGLKGITSLKELRLGCRQISEGPVNRAFMKLIFYTDAGLDGLAGLPQLESLSLIRADITGAGLKHLAGATKLKELDLTDSLVDDAGLKNLTGLKSLESLNLMQTRITDKGLAALEGLTHLKTLNLTGTDITEAGLKHLAGLINLQELQLRKTPVKDGALQHLKGLKNLETLNLGGTRVTDAGIAQLGPLKKLLSLYTDGTAVTPEGKMAFEKLRDAE